MKCLLFKLNNKGMDYMTLFLLPKVDNLFVAGRPVFIPDTPGPREDVWPARQNSNNSGHFDISVGSPAKQTIVAGDAGNRRLGAHPVFGQGATGNPSMTLRNLILSPIKRPQLSRNRNQLFT
jgi:E3 ubiquitin-protein ligase CCNP1IP1